LLPAQYRKYFSIPVHLEQPSILLPKDETLKEKKFDLIINKTSRFYNETINYKFLDEIPRVGFIGLFEEYEHFVKRHQLYNLQYLQTPTALDVANLMQSSGIFLGNQSSAFAIAEGMKVPRLLEVFEPAPNVIPIGGECIEFIQTHQVIHYLSEFKSFTFKERYPELSGGFAESIYVFGESIEKPFWAKIFRKKFPKTWRFSN
jgi:hypothetical protein